MFPGITYPGGRRGGSEDKIKRPTNLIPSDTAAQALTAFHGNPTLAYNSKASIWENDTHYAKTFCDSTHAEHIVFVFSLHKALGDFKIELLRKQKAGTQLTEQESQSANFLRYRGSAFLLTAAVGQTMELLIGRPIASPFLLRFKGKPTFEETKGLWRPVLEASLAFRKSLESPLMNGLKRKEEVEKALNEFRSLIEATRIANAKMYRTFADSVDVAPWN